MLSKHVGVWTEINQPNLAFGTDPGSKLRESL